MTTTVSTSFLTAVGVSATLRVGKGETINVAISGTYAQSIRLEKALTPSEDAWVTVAGPWTTANATVADASYVTTDTDTRLRLNMYAYTSGTAVTTISDGVRSVVKGRDQDGNPYLTVTDNEVQTDRGLRSATTLGQGGPVAVGAALTVTAALHAGRTLLLNTLASSAATLPAATGTGDKYKFVVSAAATSGAGHSVAAVGTDVIIGIVGAMTDNPNTSSDATVIDTAYLAASVASANTLTLNHTTTGGVTKGDWVEFEDIASGIWHIRGFIDSSGTEATPFTKV